jgi:hypothetical protein
MNPEQQARFDALEALRAAAWASFNARRGFEWKLAISLWTAVAAFAGSLVSGRLIITGCTRLAMVIMLLIVFALHVYFIRGLVRAHEADRRIIYFIRDKMMETLNMTFPDDLKKLLDDRGKTMADILNWSYLPQLGVTAVLTSGAIFCLF